LFQFSVALYQSLRLRVTYQHQGRLIEQHILAMEGTPKDFGHIFQENEVQDGGIADLLKDHPNITASLRHWWCEAKESQGHTAKSMMKSRMYET